jgi:hypothetical protein
MKMKLGFCALPALFCFSLLALPARLASQQAASTGRVEFVALVAPSGGQPEPVRQMTFYLLRKSVEDIRNEAAQISTGIDLDQFIDSLSLSPELKAWMHKHHSVRLNGEEFTKGLTPEEIVGVPEFFKAYMTHNAAFRAGFPEPKFKEKEKVSNPEKYNAQMAQYKAAARKFIATAPDTVQGLDLELVDLNPSPKWQSIERQQRQGVDARAFQLAEQRYMAARCNTDLDGHGSFPVVPPGRYWIGMFGAEATSGDVRIHWDYPVTVRQGETASVELSNVNAARPTTSAQNSIN